MKMLSSSPRIVPFDRRPFSGSLRILQGPDKSAIPKKSRRRAVNVDWRFLRDSGRLVTQGGGKKVADGNSGSSDSDAVRS